jgi:hypothetical protein
VRCPTAHVSSLRPVNSWRHDQGAAREALWAVLAALLAVGGCGHETPEGLVQTAPAGAVSRLDVPASAFRQEFEAILDGIDRHYGLKELKGIDTAALRARFGPDLDRAGDAAAFCAVLVRLFAALHNSHSGLILPPEAFAHAGIGTVLIGDRLVLTGEVADPVLRDHGLARGWEIRAIDDVPLTQWMAGRADLVNASTLQYQRVAAAQQASRRFWFEPAPRRFTFRDPTGTTVTLEVRLDRASSASSAPPIVSSRARADVGYVAVNSLTGNVVSLFESELASRAGRSTSATARPSAGVGVQLRCSSIRRPADRRERAFPRWDAA